MSTKRFALRRPGIGRVLYVLAGLALGLALPASGLAQESGKPAKSDVVGYVTDGVTGGPLAGVLVEIEALDRSAFTNRDGRFIMRDVPRGKYEVQARQLGYKVWLGEFDAGVTETWKLALAADPVLLEEIRVVSDRIERRRKATAMSAFAYEADELNASAAFDVRHFVRTRVPVVSCPTSFIANECVLRRGRLIVPRVYIDEVRLLGGFEFLSLYDPNELYLIEVFDSGSQIRLYTKSFAERLALGQEHVMPILTF